MTKTQLKQIFQTHMLNFYATTWGFENWAALSKHWNMIDPCEGGAKAIRSALRHYDKSKSVVSSVRLAACNYYETNSANLSARKRELVKLCANAITKEIRACSR